MDDKVYLVCTITSTTDVDSEDLIDYLGVAMSESRAKEIVDAFEPEGEYVKQEDYCWEWPRESRWDHTVTLEIYYVPLNVF